MASFSNSSEECLGFRLNSSNFLLARFWTAMGVSGLSDISPKIGLYYMLMITFWTCDVVGLTHVNLTKQRCETIPSKDNPISRYDGYDKGHISIPSAKNGDVCIKCYFGSLAPCLLPFHGYRQDSARECAEMEPLPHKYIQYIIF